MLGMTYGFGFLVHVYLPNIFVKNVAMLYESKDPGSSAAYNDSVYSRIIRDYDGYWILITCFCIAVLFFGFYPYVQLFTAYNTDDDGYTYNGRWVFFVTLYFVIFSGKFMEIVYMINYLCRIGAHHVHATLYGGLRVAPAIFSSTGKEEKASSSDVLNNCCRVSSDDNIRIAGFENFIFIWNCMEVIFYLVWCCVYLGTQPNTDFYYKASTGTIQSTPIWNFRDAYGWDTSSILLLTSGVCIMAIILMDRCAVKMAIPSKKDNADKNEDSWFDEKRNVFSAVPPMSTLASRLKAQGIRIPPSSLKMTDLKAPEAKLNARIFKTNINQEAFYPNSPEYIVLTQATNAIVKAQQLGLHKNIAIDDFAIHKHGGVLTVIPKSVHESILDEFAPTLAKRVSADKVAGTTTSFLPDGAVRTGYAPNSSGFDGSVMDNNIVPLVHENAALPIGDCHAIMWDWDIYIPGWMIYFHYVYGDWVGIQCWNDIGEHVIWAVTFFNWGFFIFFMFDTLLGTMLWFILNLIPFCLSLYGRIGGWWDLFTWNYIIATVLMFAAYNVAPATADCYVINPENLNYTMPFPNIVFYENQTLDASTTYYFSCTLSFVISAIAFIYSVVRLFMLAMYASSSEEDKRKVREQFEGNRAGKNVEAIREYSSSSDEDENNDRRLLRRKWNKTYLNEEDKRRDKFNAADT